MRSPLRMYALAGAVALGLCALGNTAGAAVSYSYNFNAPTYSDTSLVGQDGWAQTGTTATTPITVSSTATNGVVNVGTTGQDVNHTFAAAGVGSYYVSTTINLSAAQAAGDYFIHLGDGGTSNFYGRTFAKSSGAGYVLALNTSSGGTQTYGSTVLSFGQNYTLLMRYDLVSGAANDTGALFIDPTDSLGVGDTAYVTATNSGTDAATISSINIRQGNASNAPTLTLDNLSVTTPDPTPVPEPASLSLLALGGAALLIRRRK